jgi:hypothetical protein
MAGADQDFIHCNLLCCESPDVAEAGAASPPLGYLRSGRNGSLLAKQLKVAFYSNELPRAVNCFTGVNRIDLLIRDSWTRLPRYNR